MLHPFLYPTPATGITQQFAVRWASNGCRPVASELRSLPDAPHPVKHCQENCQFHAMTMRRRVFDNFRRTCASIGLQVFRPQPAARMCLASTTTENALPAFRRRCLPRPSVPSPNIGKHSGGTDAEQDEGGRFGHHEDVHSIAVADSESREVASGKDRP